MNVRAGLIRTALNGTARVAPRAAGRLTYPVFFHPPARVAVRPAEQPVLARATRTTMTVNGCALPVYAWGDGDRPVLLLHGWLSRASRWSPMVEALRAHGYSPVAFDAPGHGDAEGRGATLLDYAEIADRLHAEHGRFAAVIGHSLGGIAAFWSVRGGLPADRLVSLAAPASFDYLIDRFRDRLGLGPWAATQLRRLIEERFFPGAPAQWPRLSPAHEPGELALPMLVAHDEADDMVDRAQADLLVAAHAARADLLITRGLGHRRIMADSEVIAAVLDFAAVTDPATRPGRAAADASPAPAAGS